MNGEMIEKKIEIKSKERDNSESVTEAYSAEG